MGTESARRTAGTPMTINGNGAQSSSPRGSRETSPFTTNPPAAAINDRTMP